MYTVKPPNSGHLQDREKCPLLTDVSNVDVPHEMRPKFGNGFQLIKLMCRWYSLATHPNIKICLLSTNELNNIKHRGWECFKNET